MAGVAAHTPGMRMSVPVPYHPFQCIPLVLLPFNISRTPPKRTLKKRTRCVIIERRHIGVSRPWRLDCTGKNRTQLPTQLHPLNRIAPPPPPTDPQAVLECPPLRTRFIENNNTQLLLRVTFIFFLQPN